MNYSDKYSKYFSYDMMEDVAETQADLFAWAEQQRYDMDSFIPLYLQSDFCNREMDAIDSYFHWKTEAVLMSYLEAEQVFPKLLRPKDNKFFDVYWMGKMYRMLVFATGLSSREILGLVDSEAMNKYSIALELKNIEDAVSQIVDDITIARATINRNCSLQHL